ncbi:MAG: hypothetical protein KDC24_08360 [Saprospiraceae bacterium]|nr:hypothetical protein [Saprospiraceae bacterium]
MSLGEKVNFIVYRIREKGLEVFLLSHDKDDELHIPQGDVTAGNNKILFKKDDLIELDPVEKEDGNFERSYAVEGDWHDIPSLKGLIKKDIHFVKDKFEEILPELEKGTFIAVKEALKKVMPHQYNFLKELKDIITDRNSVKDI